MKRILYLFYLNHESKIVPVSKNNDDYDLFEDILKFWFEFFENGKGIFRKPMTENDLELFYSDIRRSGFPIFISHRSRGEVYYIFD